MQIKPVLKRILPEFVLYPYRKLHILLQQWKVATVKRLISLTWESVCKRKVAAIKDKDVLTVLFLPANLGMWKYDSLFRKMMEHPRFHPLILPSPSSKLDKHDQEKEIEKIKKSFSEKGFPVVGGASEVNPDFVFITQDSGGFTHKLTEFPRALGCYAPYYALPPSFDRYFMNFLDLNRVWRIFIQNKTAYDGTVAAMTNKGVNVRITGYLNADRFLPKDVPFSFPWKSKNPALKKVIYAPHWTVQENPALPYATFLSMGKIMLELAEKYADKIQWCFKPHPWLFRELKKLPEWGEERARAYFKRWEELENATYHDGEYISLFMTSDAMIHDCGSFRFEYFYTKKPVMFLMKEGQNIRDNDLTQQALDAHYHGRSREDIEKFLEETVLEGNDPKADEREHFLKEYLLPPNNQSVAQNIIDEIERGLGWKK